jgi:hypothetical protein
MSISELKVLWFRDKAYLLKKASIDRIDPDGHYEFDNCRYIELSDNVKRARRPKNRIGWTLERRKKYEFTVSQRIAESSFDRRPIQIAGSEGSGSLLESNESGSGPDKAS